VYELELEVDAPSHSGQQTPLRSCHRSLALAEAPRRPVVVVVEEEEEEEEEEPPLPVSTAPPVLGRGKRAGA
jgi:hypothetical protein